MKQSIFYFGDDATMLNLFQEMFVLEYDVRTATTLAEARRTTSRHRHQRPKHAEDARTRQPARGFESPVERKRNAH